MVSKKWRMLICVEKSIVLTVGCEDVNTDS